MDISHIFRLRGDMMKNGFMTLLFGMGLGAGALFAYDQTRNGNVQKMYNNMMAKKSAAVNKGLDNMK